MTTRVRVLVPIALAALIASCAITSSDQAGETSTSLRETAQSIDDMLLPLDQVSAAFAELVNHSGAKLDRQFDTFSDALDRLTSRADVMKGRATSMREQGDDYMRSWDVELATIHNDDIRDRSQDRKEAVAKQLEQVMADYLDTTNDLNPFLADLDDIHTALATDLTVDGLASVSIQERRITSSASKLRASLVSQSDRFKSLGVSLGATSSGRHAN